MDTAANCGLTLPEPVSGMPQVMTSDTVRECSSLQVNAELLDFAA